MCLIMFAPHIEGSQLPYETELFVSSICVEFPVQPVVDVTHQHPRIDTGVVAILALMTSLWSFSH